VAVLIEGHGADEGHLVLRSTPGRAAVELLLDRTAGGCSPQGSMAR